MTKDATVEVAEPQRKRKSTAAAAPASKKAKTPAKAAPAVEKKAPAKASEEKQAGKRKAGADIAKSEPARKKQAAADSRVYVTGVTNATGESLRAMFADCGKITTVFIHDKGKEYSLITFSTAEEAHKAVKEFDGKEVNGATLHVNLGLNNKRTNDLFIGGIAKDATPEWVTRLFDGIATVTSVHIPKFNLPQYKNLQSYFAFATLESAEACSKAAVALHGKTVDGHVLSARTQKGTDKAHKNDVFIGGLSKEATTTSVSSLFEGIAKITGVFIPNANSPKYRKSPTHFAFVTLDTVRDVAKVVAALNGKTVDGQTLEVRGQ
eukprot:TRINITY_DN213_c0_g1_i1.p1 TRINITY_DN213_c0_g1~~TRINITY_DN213_c0_g1_i1.p1  ORF type:complete len:341 (-),score=93.08 TRINITY_DN213_c0_g1_i1:43-1008(-)